MNVNNVAHEAAQEVASHRLPNPMELIEDGFVIKACKGCIVNTKETEQIRCKKSNVHGTERAHTCVQRRAIGRCMYIVSLLLNVCNR